MKPSQSTSSDGLITYRQLSFRDCEPVLALIAKNDERFQKVGLSQLPKGEDDYLKWLSSSDDCVVGAFQNKACIGFAGATHMRVGNMPKPGAGLWYGVDVDAQGKGVATNATIQALRHFNEKFSAVDTAVIHCQSKNKKSLAMATRLGFEKSPEADYRRYQSSRSFTSFEGHRADIVTLLVRDLNLEFSAAEKKKKIDKIIEKSSKAKSPGL